MEVVAQLVQRPCGVRGALSVCKEASEAGVLRATRSKLLLQVGPGAGTGPPVLRLLEG